MTRLMFPLGGRGKTAGPPSYALVMLGALQPRARTGNLYAGTVDPAEVERRRAKNRAARKARRLNRGR